MDSALFLRFTVRVGLVGTDSVVMSSKIATLTAAAMCVCVALCTAPTTRGQDGQAQREPLDRLPNRPPGALFANHIQPPLPTAVPAVEEETIPLPEIEIDLDYWDGAPTPAASPYLQPYFDRILAMPALEEEQLPVEVVTPPQNFEPWWNRDVVRPRTGTETSRPVTVESLVYDALQFSPRIHALRQRPLIRQEKIVEAAADFDVTTFMESKFGQASDPVGNTLTTGGAPRLRDKTWDYEAGIRKRTPRGGSLEMSQRLGFQDQNSDFFVPKNQGTGKLSISFTQPLFNGYGQAYNRSLIVLAGIGTNMAWADLATDVQDHLLRVTNAYWQLYLQRSVALQKRAHYRRARRILEILENRRGVDSLESQIARARAAVAARRTEIIRADASIRNLEAQLRALVTSPQLRGHGAQFELVPTIAPLWDLVPVNTRDAMVTALENRPEVASALQAVDAAATRADMSQNELLPKLNAFVETYVSGLRGDFGLGRAWVDQFSVGEPGFFAGLEFELPWGNRAARARWEARRREFCQTVHELHDALETLLADVEIAVREVNTAHRETRSTYTALAAAEDDVKYHEQLWQRMPGNESAASLLERLLEAQRRLSEQETAFAQAQTDYMMALANLQRATGTFVRAEQIHRIEE